MLCSANASLLCLHGSCALVLLQDGQQIPEEQLCSDLTLPLELPVQSHTHAKGPWTIQGERGRALLRNMPQVVVAILRAVTVIEHHLHTCILVLVSTFRLALLSYLLVPFCLTAIPSAGHSHARLAAPPGPPISSTIAICCTRMGIRMGGLVAPIRTAAVEQLAFFITAAERYFGLFRQSVVAVFFLELAAG